MIKKNIIYNTIFQFINMALPVITAPYLSRVLGASAIGVSSYAFTIAGYFVLFIMLGLNNYGNRSIALVKEDKNKLSDTFSEVYEIQLIVGAIVITCYFMFLYCYKDSVYYLAYKCSMIYVLSAVFDVNWFFFGMEKFKLTTVCNVLVRLLSTVSIFIFVKSETNVYIYICIHTVSYLAANLLIWLQIHKYAKFRFVSIKKLKIHLKPIIILFIPTLAVSIYKMMDKIMITWLSDTEQAGYYECAANIITAPLAVITAFGMVMLPHISVLIKEEKMERAKYYNQKSISAIFLITIPFALGIIGVSDNFIMLYLGTEFSECIRLLQMLAVTAPAIAFANVIRTQFIIPNKKDKIFVIATIIGAITNFTINSIFIPKYGAFGAVIGTIAAEYSVMFYQYIKMKKSMCEILWKNIFSYMFSGIIMVIIVLLLKNITSNRVINLIIQIGIGIMIYSGCIFLVDKKTVLELLARIERRIT